MTTPGAGRRSAGTLMRWIVSSSLRFRFLVVALRRGDAGVRRRATAHMPVDVFPEFAPPRVEIQTACLGLSPTEVEALVTVPLEQALNGVEGLDVMRSKSVPQLSSIELIFKPRRPTCCTPASWSQERLSSGERRRCRRGPRRRS